MSMTTMGFDEALKKLKEDMKAYRIGWAVPGKYVILYKPVSGDPIRKPYLAQWNPYSELTPWSPTTIDLLANDWVVGEPVRED